MIVLKICSGIFWVNSFRANSPFVREKKAPSLMFDWVLNMLLSISLVSSTLQHSRWNKWKHGHKISELVNMRHNIQYIDRKFFSFKSEQIFSSWILAKTHRGTFSIAVLSSKFLMSKIYYNSRNRCDAKINQIKWHENISKRFYYGKLQHKIRFFGVLWFGVQSFKVTKLFI